MNDIIFRAKRKDNDEWIYGWLVISKYGCTIIKKLGEDFIDSYLVYPQSVSMATGLKDKNDKKIFGSIPIDGEMSKGEDIIKYSKHYSNNKLITLAVRWDDNNCLWRGFYNQLEGHHLNKFDKEYIKQIGNAFDNPELLEEK